MTEYNSNMKLADGSNIKYVYIENCKIFLYDIKYVEGIYTDLFM